MDERNATGKGYNNQLETINMPFECKSLIKIDFGKAICRSDNLQICLNQLLEVAIEAQRKSIGHCYSLVKCMR